MENDRNKALRGWWIMLLFILFFCAGQSAGLYFSDIVYVPSQRIGDDPPFYFIRQDFVQGICLGISGFLGLAVGAFCWKRYPIYSGMIVWMSILWTGGALAKSIIILIKTNDILSPTTSESSWQTFEEYLNDPVILVSQGAVMILALAVAFLSRPSKRKRAVKHGVDDSVSISSS